MPIPDTVFTLVAAKAHLRVTHALEDVLITQRLDAAVAACEEYCGQAWTERANVEVRIPQCCGQQRLPMARVKTVTSVKYLKEDGGAGVMTDWPAGGYVIRTRHSGEQWIELSDVPSDYHKNADAAAVLLYTAEPPAVVPPAVVAAAMLQLGDLYATREANIVGTIIAANPTVKALLNPHRINWGV